MTDLHTWITAKVDAVEAAAVAARDEIASLIAWRAADPAAEAHIRLNGPAAVLRRCEADRRILDRHRLDPHVTYEPACKGCGTYGDHELSNVDNLNDCPELLDLAHAHGITPEILDGLDRPEPPARQVRDSDLLGPGWRLVGSRPADVPPALRGPNWKGSS